MAASGLGNVIRVRKLIEIAKFFMYLERIAPCHVESGIVLGNRGNRFSTDFPPAMFFQDSAGPAGIRRAGEVFRGLGDFFELSETPGRAAIHGFASRIVEDPPAASRSIGF